MGLFTKCTRMAKQSTKHGVQSLINVHITDGRYIHTIQTKCLYSYKLKFTLYPTISVHRIIPWSNFLSLRDSAALALWGSHAEKFDAQALMEMSKNGPVVLLFVGVTSNTFDGMYLYYLIKKYMLLPISWPVDIE